MFSSPFHRSSPYSSNDYSHGQPAYSPFGHYLSPYASRVVEEQRHNARIQVVERERELQRQRLLAHRRNERARQYMSDTYNTDTDDDDDDAYDYGFGRYLSPYEAREQAAPITSASRRSIPIRSPSPPKAPQPEPVSVSPPANIADPPSSPPSSRSESLAPSSPTPSQRQPSLFPNEQSLEESSSASNEAELVQKSLDTIQTIQKKFEDVKATFAWPTHIDFEHNGEVISVSTDGSPEPRLTVPKLAYTNHNTPLHAYNESLNRLLVQLDAVESWGELGVRERRKHVVSMVEAEAAKVERGWKAVWEGKSVDAEEEEEEVISIVKEAEKDDTQNDEGYGGEEEQQ